MARNGSGVYSVVNTFVSGSTITAAGHNQNWADLASELTNSVAADGQTTMTGPLKASTGTASAPSHTFGSDPNTGAYRIGSDNYGIAVGGTKIVDVASTGVAVTGTLTSSGAHTVTSGGLTVTDGGATVTAGGLTVTAGGATLTAGGLTLSADTIIVPTGSATAPTYSFASDSNTGIYRIGADNIGVAVSGAKVLDISATGIAVTGAVTGTSVTATNVATQAEQETGSSTTTLVSPGRQQFHQSAAKAWAMFNNAATVSASYNISSVLDVGTGAWTPIVTTAFSSGLYTAMAGIGISTALMVGTSSGNNRNTTAIPLISLNASGTLTDTGGFIDFVALGDQ